MVARAAGAAGGAAAVVVSPDVPVDRLLQRLPPLDRSRVVADLVPPPRFDEVRFDTYLPDPRHPSQAAALAAVVAFADRVARPPARRRGWRRRPPEPPERRSGIYLDGGFGVGKTHLLASLWRAAPGPKAFLTFGELTHVVGALGFGTATQELSRLRLLCIDEFELDDPGDTVLVSSLLSRLVDAGVLLAATSNTLPDRLGEGRFAADDFLREVQQLAAAFDVVRVDGADYRHRGVPRAPRPLSGQSLRHAARSCPLATLDDFAALMAHLAVVHPSRYGAMLDGVELVCLSDVRPLTDQAAALRLVVLADRLYDRVVPVAASGCPLDQVFSSDMLTGGFRKKYWRAVSRLVALADAQAGCAAAPD
jgi:cell division protein ZapE